MERMQYDMRLLTRLVLDNGDIGTLRKFTGSVSETILTRAALVCRKV